MSFVTFHPWPSVVGSLLLTEHYEQRKNRSKCSDLQAQLDFKSKYFGEQWHISLH